MNVNYSTELSLSAHAMSGTIGLQLHSCFIHSLGSENIVNR